ncbi:MAG: hypothetical protein HWE25_14240 [Alphaproteobacteria bacterium]|nr:hypothetical protein [Alphaproteobacteria bacterium]
MSKRRVAIYICQTLYEACNDRYLRTQHSYHCPKARLDLSLDKLLFPLLAGDYYSQYENNCMASEAQEKRHKYRFWLSVTAFFAAIWFGTLGLGSFAAGEGLAGENGAQEMDRVIITFGLVGVSFFALTLLCLLLAWRLRPIP